MSQLALPIGLADHAVFASFLAAGNEQLVAVLQALASGEESQGCWIWGPAAGGKTHLLQAVCARAGDDAVYLPMSMLADTGPAIVDGLESRRILCLDDVGAVAGNPDWEQALFSLYNAVLASEGTLIVAALAPPRECGVLLPDLASRLAQLPAYRLQPLPEAAQGEALRLRAEHRGIELPDDTLQYLLTRSRRDMASLYALLDRLDREALRAQRRLTVPFVREVLAAPSVDGSS